MQGGLFAAAGIAGVSSTDQVSDCVCDRLCVHVVMFVIACVSLCVFLCDGNMQHACVYLNMRCGVIVCVYLNMRLCCRCKHSSLAAMFLGNRCACERGATSHARLLLCVCMCV